ncbi:rho guanine nucleotide exchange factor 33 isoform X3 [Phyllopteryx taeniolatus]|uniref:rho guanine nucleotide exchange factor 33 isoform X3 n=1 Tax=Phyllopteryx taeniolatus TaxID=161469 RepID=UPI002AD55C3F|nr:rho guanine nucleotide exchange factor 33 isoform X3 [Phyllopteryx taeniolatus]
MMGSNPRGNASCTTMFTSTGSKQSTTPRFGPHPHRHSFLTLAAVEGKCSPENTTRTRERCANIHADLGSFLTNIINGEGRLHRFHLLPRVPLVLREQPHCKDQNMGDSPRDPQDHTEDVTPNQKDKEEDKSVPDANMAVAQLQGLVAELREGLRDSLAELCELRQEDRRLEESLRAHRTHADQKITGLKNSLNTFKEELSAAFFHIQDVSNRQRELTEQLEQQQPETPVGVAHSRKSSKSDVLSASEDERVRAPGQSELSIIRCYFAESQRSVKSAQTSTSEQQKQQRCCWSRNPAWGGDRNGSEDTDASGNLKDNGLRQKAALELLESERIYVSHLSLLLKANITFNGSEALAAKDKRPFPSSLRFLIQQHLDLLHTLQERVLRCQWQGIMGDIFMRLTSKESDFLDLYVSYLKELPDCLNVVSMLAADAVTSSAFLESDIVGDESKPSLPTLLLQPVQRIPEYLQLLQGLLRQTESSHPDYYLLLLCIQQFRCFSSQQQHLLQRNQELLMHNRQEVKRSSTKQLLRPVEGGLQGSPYIHGSTVLEHTNQAKHSKQRLLEQIQSSHRFHEWDREHEPEASSYQPDWPPQLQYYSPDVDSRKHKPTGLGSIPESDASERSGQHPPLSRTSEFRQVQPGSALAHALEEFLLTPDPPGMESLYEEDRGSPHDASAFDRYSSASSDSSIDIAFVKCPKAPATPSRHVPTSRDIFGNGYNKLPNRGCASPDEAVLMRQAHQRPLQPGQRKKSKSLNGLQMDSAVTDGGHAKLERQGSRGSRGCVAPSRKIHSSPGSRKDAERPGDDLHGLLGMDSAMQPWGGEENHHHHHHTPFSERSRKQDKGGFRSSFKKLFKKKGGDDKKEKAAEKGQENQQADVRGTAV